MAARRYALVHLVLTQFSGSLARGTRLIEKFVQAEPTPQSTMAFELELSALRREVGRRMMAWMLNRLEPEADDEAPSRIEFEGRLYRRRRPQRLAPSACLLAGGTQ